MDEKLLLIQFSFEQLFNFNVHIGAQQKHWNPLNSGLVAGLRQSFFFFNLNLSIVNLRYSFLVIKHLLHFYNKLLYFNSNPLLTSVIIDNFKLYSFLKIHFGLGKWLGGFLTNFKSIRKKIRLSLYKLFNRVSVFLFKQFFKYNYSRIWNFFFYLKNLRVLPAGVFLMEDNEFAVFELEKLKIFSMCLSDLDKTESVYLSLMYLIPFNFTNFYSLVFLVHNFRYLYLLNLVNQKKQFFFLLISLLEYNCFNKFSNVNLVYSLLINLSNNDLISQRKWYLNKLLNLKILK